MARQSKTETPEAPPERPRGARPLWSGSISFGLVNIPIRLYPAVKAKDVRFHLLHEKDKSRIQEKLFCPVDNEEISRQETVKGYEIGKGQYVVVSQEEINSLAPKASRTIELLNVTDIQRIDPMYFDRPFYLMPEERAAKAYYLLLEALQNARKGAIAKFVMRNKEYMGAIRPIKNVLYLETLRFADEIVTANDLKGTMPAAPTLREAEVKMASQLLESLEEPFDPAKLHDDYREGLLNLIQRKAEGEEIVVQPEVETEAPQVIDLMEALKKSVAEVQRTRKRKAA